MTHETATRKAMMANEIAFAINKMDKGYAIQMMTVYLSRLSVKDLKEAKKDIKKLQEYINK